MHSNQTTQTTKTTTTTEPRPAAALGCNTSDRWNPAFKALIAAQGYRSIRQWCHATGLPWNTVYRRFAGLAPMNVETIARVAKLLDMNPHVLANAVKFDPYAPHA